MIDTIKIRLYIGVTHEGGWETPNCGSSVPLSDESAIDALWEGTVGSDDACEGYAFYAIDLELPRPVRAPPLETTPSAIAAAVRVDSKAAVIRGRKEALAHVLRTCELTVAERQKIDRLAWDPDVDMEEVP